jgi:hypothetical protein
LIFLLETMKPDTRDRTDGLMRIKRWVDEKLGAGN